MIENETLQKQETKRKPMKLKKTRNMREQEFEM